MSTFDEGATEKSKPAFKPKKEAGGKYRVLVPYEYQKDGVTKNGWTDVGVAFNNASTGMTLLLRPGISISGRICILPANTEDSKILGAVNELKGFKYSKLTLDEMI